MDKIEKGKEVKQTSNKGSTHQVKTKTKIQADYTEKKKQLINNENNVKQKKEQEKSKINTNIDTNILSEKRKGNSEKTLKNNNGVNIQKSKQKIKEENSKTVQSTGVSQETKVYNIIKSSDLQKEIKNNNNKIEKVSKNVEPKEVVKQSTKRQTANTLKKNKKYNNYEDVNKKKNFNNYEKNNEKNNNNNNNNENNSKKINNYNKNNKEKKSKTKALKILLIIIILILVILIGSTILGIININSKKIIKGVFINNIEISNLTTQQAVEKVNNELNNNEKNIITVKRDNFSKQIHLQDINGKFIIEDAVNHAFNIGREGDIVNNNYKTIQTIIKKENINVSLTYDKDLLQQIINEININMPDIALDSSYIIEENNLIIKNSTEGNRIKNEKLIQDIEKAFSTQQKNVIIEVEKCEKKEIDIEKIHNEIYKKPVNAYYTKNPQKIYKEENGIDFAISLEEAKNLLLEDKTEYVIPLKTIKPKITVANLDSGAYPNLLSTFTTTYGTADINRNTNIALAAKSINSVVLMPGEVFSYNDLIGECSTRTGYKTSTIYLNGKLSTGVGGGICQVSTTLYNTVLRANLEIVERRNHSLGVTYVPSGQDAMVSIGTQDFKFKNNRKYPIKVVAYVGTGSITCQIYGLKQNTEYEVKLYSRTISKTDTKYKVETYKILYLNGKEVSRSWLSTDTYKYH